MPSRAGSPNKNKGALKRRLKARFGDDFDVVEEMATIAYEITKTAKATGEIVDLKEAVTAWDKVANYVEPKLKAVEHSGEMSGKLIVKRINLTGNAIDNEPND